MRKGILMTEKTKRKGNPRRRTLFRLILLAGIVAIIISYAVYSLLPDGAEIVFIAPDDNGIDQIWLANLNDTENPRQLTFHDDYVYNLRSSDTGRVISYNLNSDPAAQIWIYNLDTGQHEQISNCTTRYCGSFYDLSSDGQQIVYEMYDDHIPTGIAIYDIENRESQVIQELEVSETPYITYPRWLEHNNLIVYVEHDLEPGVHSNDHIFFDLETHQTEARDLVHLFTTTASFSPYGDYYAFRDTGAIQTFVRHVDYPDEPMFDLATVHEEYDLVYSAIYDWHPDEISILLGEQWHNEDDGSQYFEINLYNIETGDHTTLVSNDNGRRYYGVGFNYNASRFIFQSYEADKQLMLYNMDSRELIPLPLSGHTLQWVNGGR